MKVVEVCVQNSGVRPKSRMVRTKYLSVCPVCNELNHHPFHFPERLTRSPHALLDPYAFWQLTWLER
ncbi:hypothetical protein AcV7_003969 [Taiwanofungus camphoratus]|nr:hypothetical protein AcV7_003969 [Antrodia cinnamomea]